MLGDSRRLTARARLSHLCAAVVLLAGCDEGELRWRVVVEPAEADARAVVVDVQVRRDGCDGPILWEAELRDGLDAPRPPAPAGAEELWLTGVAYDADCASVARGCARVSLPSSDAEVILVLESEEGVVECPPDRCELGRCGEPPPDAGPPDAASDGGRDAGHDAGACGWRCIDDVLFDDCEESARACPHGCAEVDGAAGCLELVPSNVATEPGWSTTEAFALDLQRSGESHPAARLNTSTGVLDYCRPLFGTNCGVGAWNRVLDATSEHLEIVDEVPDGGAPYVLLHLSELNLPADTEFMISGSRAAIFLVRGEARIMGRLRVQAGAGAGGGNGGAVASTDRAGGGGGGLGGAGGEAGGGEAGGAAVGATSVDAIFEPLRGGAPGGIGRCDCGLTAAGGAGGGALQISAAHLDIGGRISVRGAGGRGGRANTSGGGGGAGGGSGGTLLLEALTVAIPGELDLAGGGGGSGATRTTEGCCNVGQNGVGDGSSEPPTGGTSRGPDSGPGGEGGHTSPDGSPGRSDRYDGGGGGGAGLGRIRVHGDPGVPGDAAFTPPVDSEVWSFPPARVRSWVL